MPSYEHICENVDCKHEWEDFYSIAAAPPKNCPKCNQETAKRLISGGSGKGVMVLSDDEFKAGLKHDVMKLKKEMYSSEKKYANYLGEDKYQSMQTQMDRNKREKY